MEQLIQIVPPEYEALRTAFTRLFRVCGSAQICGACFNGKLHNFYIADTFGGKRIRAEESSHSRGCCGSCANAGPMGCIDKPVLCSAWYCGDLARVLPDMVMDRLDYGLKSKEPLRSQLHKIPQMDAKSDHYWGAYKFGMEHDAKHPYTGKQKQAMQALADKLNELSDEVVEKGIQPNWKYVELMLGAKIGTFTRRDINGG